MRAAIYTLAAAAAMLVLVLSVPFTATASANYQIETPPVSQDPEQPPTGVGVSPFEETPPAEDTLTLEQNSITQESQVAVAAAASPTIVVWGETEGELYFGQLGNPQPRININGNVSDPDNDITNLKYMLDGSSPDPDSVPYNPNNSSPRLARRGDFTIEIPTAGLSEGLHQVKITATHSSGNPVTKTVNFHYSAGRVWSLPYSTNWNSATFINQRSQIVDGSWRFDTSAGYKGVRPQNGYTGYDRIIAIGDMGWSNYEVTVPITVWSAPSDQGGVGIISNWQGHKGTSALPDQWYYMGAYGYYSFKNGGRLAMWLNHDENPTATNPDMFKLTEGVTYIFKLRSERINGGGRYSLKVWQQGTPEPAYNASQFAGVSNVEDVNGPYPDQTQGSVLLNAHLVDATFGDVTITPIQDNKQYIPLIKK